MKNVEGLRYKRTLFVGLGGAGAKTLRKLKGKIIAANGGKIPKQVKFLLIDTNATELSNYRDFDSSEKICIAVREPYERYKHDYGTPTHKFIPEQNAHSLLALERGAGQIRSNGHFAVIENEYSYKLMRVFRERADELADIDVKGITLEKDPKIEVRLAFSLAGGTGSGTFLPIATILRAAINHCELTAYIYSATHYSKKVENSAKYSVMQNAYAALCELDYMMHFGRDKRHENVVFNFGPDERQHIEQSKRPFEEVYYIDKHTSYPNSDSVEFAYNEIERLQENAAEAMHIAATNIITAHTGTVDNVRQKIAEGQFDVGDKYAWMSGFGIAELYLKSLDRTNPEIIDLCCNSIYARTNPDIRISDNAADDIATEFIKKYKWDESGRDMDGDPILRRFVTKDVITNKCNELIHSSNDLGASYQDFALKLDLDKLLEKQNKTSNKIVEDSIDEFRTYINDLIKSLINNDSFDANFVQGYYGKGPGLSFNTIKQILDKIEEKLQASKTMINSEMEEHKEARDKSHKELNKKRAHKPTPQPQNKPFWQRIFGGNNNPTPVNNNPAQTLQPLAGDILDCQFDSLYNHILSQRDNKTIEIFDGCISIVTEAKDELIKWRDFLVPAYDFGCKQRRGASQNSKDTEIAENRVEVQMMDIQGGFRIKYDELKKFANSETVLQSDQSKYNAVCDLLSVASGSLQDYLKAGLKEIENLSSVNKVKVERTECQQKIDRLIDLSTPTMQVDSHGFGEKVKEDHFWYIMTDCPEENFAQKPKDNGDGNDKVKSVGELLKIYIEQNTLDAKINKVHVPGWTDKAILYRVDSAVPAYFVEGVCISPEVGYTLEGCYEELKKTKSKYTPFSHEFLRKKLENGICVLKPNEDISQDVALEYWVNFNLLDKIIFEPEEGDVKTTKGRYSILSERAGACQTDNLTDNKKILVLGNTRHEAYETFTRYCKTLLEEYSSYNDDVDIYKYPSDEAYAEKLIMTGNEYMDKLLKTRGIEWTLLRMPKDDPEHSFLKTEIEFMNKRYQQFYNGQTNKESLNKLVDVHNVSQDSAL